MSTKCPQISIIVAIYNSEKYISRCLDSIKNQTFKDFEVLLVDDGSNDKSGEICDEYAKCDSRFKVLHKENDGVSSARQFGIDHALGIYSIHVDPDDWVEADYLESLYNKIVNDDADICFCHYILEYKNCQKFPPSPNHDHPIFRNPIDELLPIYGSAMWNKLIRHDLYHKCQIIFPNSLTMGEDSYVLVKLLLSKPKITIINKYLYHYDRYSNPHSLTSNYCKYKLQNQLEYINLIDELNENELLSNYRNLEITTMAHDAFYYNVFNQKDYIKHFGKYFFTIITSSSPFHKKINIILSLMGLKWLVHPLYIILKKKFYTRE